MKKTFQLQSQDRHRDRVVEAVKHEIRKYIRRERRRELPSGADYWDFDCRFGAAAESAEVVHLSTLTALIDAVVMAQGQQFYLEVLARPAQRQVRPHDATAGAA